MATRKYYSENIGVEIIKNNWVISGYKGYCTMIRENI